MKTELQERADSLVSNLQRSVDTCFEVLRSISQLFASSEQIKRSDFQRFVQPALARHPSIQALEWLPRLQKSDRLKFEQMVQAEGFPQFCITEQDANSEIIPARQRDEYFPVYYTEPLSKNQLALGFDLASDPTRWSALEKARDTGAIAISGRIELVQEAQKQYGFLVILPIYQQGGSPAHRVARREQLQGFVLGVFRLADVVQSALNGLNLEHIDFSLQDQSNSKDESLLAFYASQQQQVLADSTPNSVTDRGTPSDAASDDTPAICSRSFAVADRQWLLILIPTPAYVDRAELYQQSQLRADTATAEAEKLKLVLRNLQQTQARWLLEKKMIAVGVGLVLLILGSANLSAYQNMTRLFDNREALQQAYTAIASLSRLLSLSTPSAATRLNEPATVPNPPVSTNSSASTNSPVSTNPTTSAIAAVELEISQLRQATLDTLSQQQLAALEQLLAQTFASSQSGGTQDLSQPQIQQLIAEMEQNLRSQLQQGNRQASHYLQQTLLINIVSIAFSLTLLAGVYYLLQRQMTERQQVESALFEANSQLELEVQQRSAELERTKEISDLKMRLFSMVSHEFRTPLSTILVSTQLLASSDRTWNEEKKTKNLTRIQTAAKTMAQLLSDILTLSRAEAGKLECHPEWIDLAPFCRQVMEAVQHSVDASRSICWQCQSPSTHASVDTKLLHSILSNLLSNALKYSSAERPVWLILECAPDAVIFQVKDEGIGIAPDDQQRLYETFYRGQNVGDIVGTGLGLAVVKTCVDLHGGQVTVDSEMGIGTTFTVTLPRGVNRNP